jgi:F-type H+-transporting ATPase subunit delta
MADLAAARRYAQAAFDLANETGGDLDSWRADLDDVATVLAESDAAPMLADARIPVERRLAAVERMLDVPPLALNVARLLVQKGRSLDARAVADAFGRMADEAQGIQHAVVTTAVELTPEQAATVRSRLGASLGATVKLTTVVEPRLVGGIVIRVGDRLVDGSVRARLRRLEKELSGAG